MKQALYICNDSNEVNELLSENVYVDLKFISGEYHLIVFTDIDDE